jgi:tetratricopeptide (TPR) repeat protein
MRAALEWSLAGAQPEPGLRIVVAIWPYWWRQGQHIEWRNWVSRAEKASGDARPVVQAGVLRAKGNMLFAFHRLSETRRILTDALAIYRSLGNDFETGTVLVELSMGSIGIASEYEEAVEKCQEGLALLRQIEAEAEIAHGLNVLGELARAQGENDLAQSAYEECLAVAIKIGDRLREGFQYGNLGAVAMNRGDYNQARDWLKLAGNLAAELGNRWFVLDNLAYLACAIGGSGQPRRAARLMGAGEALHTTFEVELQANDLPDYERWVAMVHEELGEETFNALREEGSAMSLDEALALASSDADDE